MPIASIEGKEPLTIGMFSASHVVILLIFAAATAAFFVLITKFKPKTDKSKEIVLKIMAVVTFVVHISVIWYWYFAAVRSETPFKLEPNFLLPLATCNVIAFFNLVIAFLDKKGRVFKFLAPSCAWLGIIGGVLSVLAGKSGVLDYDAIRSLTSHLLMFLTGTYLFIAGYVKIRVSNLTSVIAMLLFNGLLGLASMLVTGLYGMSQNPMWFDDGLIEGIDATRGWFAALYVVIIVFAFAAVWEWIKIKNPVDRWYMRLRNFGNGKETEEGNGEE
ncbi:MAG: hypothetical protein FWE84_02585 [Firmicutes bacterium]|nr:hypothetical protein [Bacillota bacterium]